METCGQCPGAMSPDLLLGRSRKYCDEGKAMYFELSSCVWREQGWSEALPEMHSRSPGVCSGQGPISSVLLLLRGPVSCEYSLPDLALYVWDGSNTQNPDTPSCELQTGFKTPKRICRLAVFVWFLFSCSFCMYKRGFVLHGP